MTNIHVAIIHSYFFFDKHEVSNDLVLMYDDIKNSIQDTFSD